MRLVAKCLRNHDEENSTSWVEKKTRKHIKLMPRTTFVKLLEFAHIAKLSIRIIDLFRSRGVQPTYTWSQNV